MRHLFDSLGIVGLMVITVVWGCIMLVLGGPIIGRFLDGALFTAFYSASPLAALSCPLTLSVGEIKTITATIANPPSEERTYLVIMEQPPRNFSSGSIELCSQEVTIQSDSEMAASCLVRLEDLDSYSSTQTSWYVFIRVVTPPETGYLYVPEHEFAGSCLVRRPGDFWNALWYGGGVIVSALAIVFWGAYRWPKSKGVDRTLIILLSIVVYGLAWLINSMVWVGLSNLHLSFLILGGMLLVMFLILWSMG